MRVAEVAVVVLLSLLDERGSEMRRRKLGSVAVAGGFLLLLPLILSAVGCKSVEKKVTFEYCNDIDENNKVCVESEFKFSTSGGDDVDADSLFETREIDPNVLAHVPDGTHRGTVTLTLSDGSTVSTSQNLTLDTGTSVSTITSGHEALVYRPSNPSALQSFIESYKGVTDSGVVRVRIELEDISNGSTESTVVDNQGQVNYNLDYIGSVSVSLPSFDRPGGDPIPK